MKAKGPKAMSIIERTMTRVALAVVLLVALSPALAFAKETVVHSQVVSQVSGAQIAQQLIGQVKGVQLGSNGATLTVAVDGKAQPVRLDYSALTGAAGNGASGGDIGGLTRLFAIPVFGGIVLKLVSMLTRLGRQ